MEYLDLPCDLPCIVAPVLQGDPDGEIERRVFALCRCDIVGACRLALTIRNPFRRAVWLRGFRAATIAAAKAAAAPA